MADELPLSFKTTAEIKVPERLIDQVIGQERAVDIVRKAASQKRNVLLMGQPGTGKSLLAQAMAELLPATELEDVLAYRNALDENNPLIRVVKTYEPEDKKKEAPSKDDVGQGRRTVEQEKMKARMGAAGNSPLMIVLLLVASVLFLFFITKYVDRIIAAALMLGMFIFAGALIFGSQIARRGFFESDVPKLIVDNSGKKVAPFVDATGAKANALLGDVRHDPLQSGGLGTPAHLRIEAGYVHKANKGVLFLDEISTLTPKSQQELLTAMQEKKYPITGQSEMSSGAAVRTEPVPCDFVLVAAGNMVDIQKMHPALRSRIRGYGYEVYMEDSMPDTPKNCAKIAQFIAQEVKKDGRIPHFSRDAVLEMINEARKRSGRKRRLTLRLRELGGIVRAAGDMAAEQKAGVVTKEHIATARGVSQTLEQQISRQFIDFKKDYRVFVTQGYAVGKVNGLAVMGDASGLVVPIVAEVAPAASKNEGRLVVTGKLGKIAKEAVDNVSAIIKKHTDKDTSSFDIHVQFLQTYEGIEGDSASISVATAVISALDSIPVEQSVAMTGSLSVRGEVLPVGGITPKVEAAIEAGAKEVLIPYANKDDVFLTAGDAKKIAVVPVKTVVDVIAHSLKDNAKRRLLIAALGKEMKGGRR
jgi:Lon-like ATP-dependent protease